MLNHLLFLLGEKQEVNPGNLQLPERLCVLLSSEAQPPVFLVYDYRLLQRVRSCPVQWVTHDIICDDVTIHT